MLQIYNLKTSTNVFSNIILKGSMYNIILIIFFLLFLPLFKQQLFHQENLKISTKILKDTPISIAIYIVYAANQTIIPDLRGHFWEPQLKDFPADHIKVNYISDLPINISGLKIFQPEPTHWQKFDIHDHTLVIRTSETWKHFERHNSRYRWYFKGGHDTYINILNLKRFLHKLEEKYNPMKDVVFRFGLHEFSHFVYPHGGSGFLLSNAAVKLVSTKIDIFRSSLTSVVGDDTALPFFFNFYLNLNVTSFSSPDFVVSFPTEIARNPYFDENNYSSVSDCPKRYQLYNNSIWLKPVQWVRAVSAHMHHVQMDRVVPFLETIPKNLAMYFNYTQRNFYFCKVNY